MYKFDRIIAFIFCLAMVNTVVMAQDDDGTIDWNKGAIHFRSNDGQFQTRFDVRMFLQAGKYLDDPEDILSDGTHLRKGRFAMKVKMWDTWRAEWDMDIADETVEIKDMWVAYTGLNNAFIKLGHFKVPFGLEILTSSRYIPFIERSYPSMAFKMGRRMSLGYTKWGEHWNVSGAYYGQEMNTTDKNKKVDETGGGYAVRVAAAPQLGPIVLHMGSSFVNYVPDDESHIVDFKSEPENKLGDAEHVDTGDLINVDHVSQVAMEGAVQLNNIFLQGEYTQTSVSRFGEIFSPQDQVIYPFNDASFTGGYVFFSWLITGEKRPWDNTQGEFGQVIPKSNKRGAWELLYRFSYLNLSDTQATDAGHLVGYQGGKAINSTFALTWYANPNIKFMANYIITDNSEYADGEGIGDYDFSAILFQSVVYF